MHAIRKAFAVATLTAVFTTTGAAFAQDHHDDNHGGYVKHSEWRKGYHMRSEDWQRGQQVDWHAHHLAAPRPGYEWREVDGNYVMAAVATGIIATAIMASGH